MDFPPLFEPTSSAALLVPIVADVDAVPAAELRCPAGTALVTGTHYEYVQRYCLDYRKEACWSFHPGLLSLEGIETPVATCIDVYEWPNKKGVLPEVMMTYREAQSSCRRIGKRLCTEFEWELACEGPKTLPYPYGYAQEPGACVNEKPYRPYSESKLLSKRRAVVDDEVARLYQAEPSGSRPRCTSHFGAVDLVGNVEEWVSTSRYEWPHASSLKGGFWSKSWSGCRGTNDSHAPAFRFYEIGFRCCSEPELVPIAPDP
ncbi:MAG: SUMF1/EgtB/PvdO family nonheme iron enzyme [Polyangiaceae bacterium]|nr:SUMF1/EgtB/PvdO family nonheme iron enzyme [Polyangiaceae bacterium]